LFYRQKNPNKLKSRVLKHLRIEILYLIILEFYPSSPLYLKKLNKVASLVMKTIINMLKCKLNHNYYKISNHNWVRIPSTYKLRLKRLKKKGQVLKIIPTKKAAVKSSNISNSSSTKRVLMESSDRKTWNKIKKLLMTNNQNSIYNC